MRERVLSLASLDAALTREMERKEIQRRKAHMEREGKSDRTRNLFCAKRVKIGGDADGKRGGEKSSGKLLAMACS